MRLLRVNAFHFSFSGEIRKRIETAKGTDDLGELAKTQFRSHSAAVPESIYSNNRDIKRCAMNDTRLTKEKLLQRRDEILSQLNRVNDDLRLELDRDPEEQAIQVEQDEVSVSMEENLRRELADIENRLADEKFND